MNEYTDINDFRDMDHYNIEEGLDKIELYERLIKDARSRLGQQMTDSGYKLLVENIRNMERAIVAEKEKLRESGYKPTRFTRLVRMWRKGIAG